MNLTTQELELLENAFFAFGCICVVYVGLWLGNHHSLINHLLRLVGGFAAVSFTFYFLWWFSDTYASRSLCREIYRVSGMFAAVALILYCCIVMALHFLQRWRKVKH